MENGSRKTKIEDERPILEHIKIKEEIMFCTKCGKEIKEGMKRCPFCGEIVQKGNTAKAAVSSDAKKSKKIKIIRIIIARLLIGGMYNAVTENEGGKSPEYSFEVSDDDLLNLLGMTEKDIQSIFGESNVSSSRLDDTTKMLFIGSIRLLSTKNRIVSITNTGESLKSCGISIGDKESTVVEQMKNIHATSDGKENLDGGFYMLKYSIKSNSTTLQFNWIFNPTTNRIATTGIHMR